MQPRRWASGTAASACSTLLNHGSARRVRRFSKLSKRRPLAYALAVVIATAFMGMLLSGYGPVAIYRAGGADGIAAGTVPTRSRRTAPTNEARGARRGLQDALARLRRQDGPGRSWHAGGPVRGRCRCSSEPGSSSGAQLRPGGAVAARSGRREAFAKRPRQSDSSITTRAKGRNVKCPGRESAGTTATSRALHKKRRRRRL